MYEDILKKVSLFSGLSDRELKEIARSAQERHYSAGTVLFHQGDTGTGLYIITAGRVRILQANDPDRAEEVIGTAGPGEVLGEMALLDDLPRSASVVAEEETTAILLPIWEFRTVLRRQPEIALKLLSVLSRRLRKAEGRLAEH
ncbi:MAG: cyclic nucleotide-binding domain-containing protein [Thermogemmatispora sp.]|uniref:cyclic nucleotide-binding domain-containing protein n=1 Tax=Thermogemmatispora sp. TaxID=1968838 RepID=UPI002627504B|nr:cyclic nucleotide-binding domain-containing protein [Thermogemmatispora sp.]MBX5457410.1 cyclic nucleotide-binding domain-containing protein [Thermogemmatispora sp.]